MHLIHLNGSLIDGPFVIKDHKFNNIDGVVSIYFDESEIAELDYDETTSVLCIFSEPRQRKIFKFIEILKRFLPYWVNIRYN